MSLEINSQDNVKDIEEGGEFAPKFDKDGFIPAVVNDHKTNEVLMFAFMNKESLAKTIELGEAVYWSRSRNELWHKGATSGHTQKIVEIQTDCDQDCLILRVIQKGGACHVGYQSCFYRKWEPGDKSLKIYREKVYDPKDVYKK